MAVVAYTDGLFDSFGLEDIKPLRTKEPTLADVLDDVALDHESWKSYDYLDPSNATLLQGRTSAGGC
jgi:DNA (cytosine-5)-methyltransferase 1